MSYSVKCLFEIYKGMVYHQLVVAVFLTEYREIEILFSHNSVCSEASLSSAMTSALACR